MNELDIEYAISIAVVARVDGEILTDLEEEVSKWIDNELFGEMYYAALVLGDVHRKAILEGMSE